MELIVRFFPPQEQKITCQNMKFKKYLKLIKELLLINFIAVTIRRMKVIKINQLILLTV